MAFEICLDACCIDCAGLCLDADNVAFLVTLSGFADATAIPNPPGLGTCEVCDDLNQTYVLQFYSADPGVPFTGCSTTDENFAFPPCFYRAFYSCYSEATEGNISRVIEISLRIYATNGGDRRGFLQMTYNMVYVNNSTMISYTRYQVRAHDFLIQSGSTSTNCLSFTLADSFDLTCGTDVVSTPAYDCDPPTNFSISVVAV